MRVKLSGVVGAIVVLAVVAGGVGAALGADAAHPEADTGSTDSVNSTDSASISTAMRIGSGGDAASIPSNGTIDVWVGAVSDGPFPAPRSGVELRVTIADPTNNVTTKTVETRSDGNAHVAFDVADRPDGVYTVSYERPGTNDLNTKRVVVGTDMRLTTENEFSPGAIVGTESNVSVRALEAGQPVENATLDVDIVGPDGNVTATRSVNTDADGYDRFSITPTQTGEYELVGDGLDVNTAFEAGAALATLETGDQRAGGTAEVAGYVYDEDGPYTGELTLSVYDGKQDSDPPKIRTVSIETTDTGLFATSFDAPTDPGTYSVTLATDANESVAIDDRRLFLREPSTDATASAGGPQLSVSHEVDGARAVAPGSTLPFSVTATDETGAPLANESVSVAARYGFRGPPVGSVTVTTDGNGTATGSLSLPEAAPELRSGLRTTGSVSTENGTATATAEPIPLQSQVLDVGSPDGPVEPGSPIDVPISVTAADGDPVANETYTFDTQSDLFYGTLETASVTTDEAGEATLATTVPGRTESKLLIATGGAYGPRGIFYSVGSWTQDQSYVPVEVYRPGLGLSVDREAATPGETITATVASQSVERALVSFTLSSDNVADYALVEPGEPVSFTIPDRATIGESYFVDVLAFDDSGTRYETREWIEVVEPDDTIAVTGSVVGPPGTSVAGDTIAVATDEAGDDWEMTVVEADGTYELTLPRRSEPYELQYYRGNLTGGPPYGQFPLDGVVDVYAVATVPGDVDTAVDTTSIPAGHLVSPTVIDEDGSPVEGARVTLTHHNNHTNGSDVSNASAGWSASTNADGIINLGGGAGLELSGAVDIEVEPPLEEGFVNATVERSLTVTGNASPEIVLERSDDGGGVTLPPPPPPEPPSFEIGAVEVLESTAPGAQLSLALPVENVGDRAGSVTVAVSLDGGVVAEETVALDGDERRSVSVTVTAPDEPGDHHLVVETADDRTSTTVTVAATDDRDDGSDDGSPVEDGDEPPTDGSNSAGDDSIPGFGVVAALAALGTLLWRRAT